ncbi:MAG: hypothetical protein U0800_17470 [Isosphaeraceae bacterium]
MDGRSDPGEIPVDELLPWARGVGHHYIGLFLTAIFLDRLAAGTLDVGGLVPSLLGATLGGLLAFAILYYPSASWGLQARAGIDRVASATFGERGARWFPGVLLAATHIVWFALCLAMAADYGKRGLISLGLIQPQDVADWALGPLRLKAPAILFETLCWAAFAAVMAAMLVRVVTAVMYTYPIFPALAISAAFCMTLPGIGDPTTASGTLPVATIGGGLVAAITMIQRITGFFAPSGFARCRLGRPGQPISPGHRRRGDRRDRAGGNHPCGTKFDHPGRYPGGPTPGRSRAGGAQVPGDGRGAARPPPRRIGRDACRAEPKFEPGEQSLERSIQHGLGPAAGVILLVLALACSVPACTPHLSAKYA